MCFLPSRPYALRQRAKAKGKGKWVTKGDTRIKGAKGTDPDNTTPAPIPPPLQASTPFSIEQIAERKLMDRASEIAHVILLV